jgi:hypothetical protein
VKPAALITHIPPHDRAVPKPAFELTEEKLNPKAAAGVTKKPPRTRVKKIAAKRKATASAKKAVPNGKQPPAASAMRAAKSPIGSGGQKPSPAVAKSQTSQGPSQ